MLKLSVIGTGYLGATHAAAMSSLGFQVVGIDIDPKKDFFIKKRKGSLLRTRFRRIASKRSCFGATYFQY